MRKENENIESEINLVLPIEYAPVCKFVVLLSYFVRLPASAGMVDLGNCCLCRVHSTEQIIFFKTEHTARINLDSHDLSN